MNGVIHRVNPAVLCIVGIASLFGSFAVNSLPVALTALGAYALMIAGSGARPGIVLICLAFAAFGGLTIAWSTWRLGGHDLQVAAVAGLRIVVLAWPGSVAAAHIDAGRLGDYAATVLPERGVAATSAALQRFATLAHTWTVLDRTRRARGLGPGRHPAAIVRHSGSMAFALLVQALRDAGRTSIAMDARGFAETRRRTWAEPVIWSRLDLAVTALAVGLGLLPLLMGLALRHLV